MRRPPGGKVDELFRPFEQRSADRTGLGLGLAFSRWGAQANNGELHARNLPGKGCVFTVDLPRDTQSPPWRMPSLPVSVAPRSLSFTRSSARGPRLARFRH